MADLEIVKSARFNSNWCHTTPKFGKSRTVTNGSKQCFCTGKGQKQGINRVGVIEKQVGESVTLNRTCRKDTDESLNKTSIGMASTPHALPLLVFFNAFFTSNIEIWSLNTGLLTGL